MPELPFDSINYLAVLTAGFAAFMLGGVWYTALFGKAWQLAHHYDDATVKALQSRRPPPVFFGLMCACYLVVAFAMAVVLAWCGVATLKGGAMVGVVVGVGIAAPIALTNHLPTNVDGRGFLIDAVYIIAYCTLMGAIIGVWN